jgi:hypothetical protein
MSLIQKAPTSSIGVSFYDILKRVTPKLPCLSLTLRQNPPLIPRWPGHTWLAPLSHSYTPRPPHPLAFPAHLLIPNLTACSLLLTNWFSHPLFNYLPITSFRPLSLPIKTPDPMPAMDIHFLLDNSSNEPGSQAGRLLKSSHVLNTSSHKYPVPCGPASVDSSEPSYPPSPKSCQASCAGTAAVSSTTPRSLTNKHTSRRRLSAPLISSACIIYT